MSSRSARSPAALPGQGVGQVLPASVPVPPALVRLGQAGAAVSLHHLGQQPELPQVTDDIADRALAETLLARHHRAGRGPG